MTQVSKVTSDSPLIFMHIPKTGGMSMFTSLATIWGVAISDLYDISDESSGKAFDALKNSNNIVYCGHYSFGLHEWLERPSYYISWLREPVARINSLYHYLIPKLEDLKSSLHESRVERKDLHDFSIPNYFLDFERWLFEESCPKSFFLSQSAELDNGMVRRFSGFGLRPGPCPNSALALAKKNIEQYFSVVGLYERYPETLELVAKTFQIDNLTEHYVNQGPSEKTFQPLDENIQKRIRDMNLLDIELYRWVSERFDQQLKNPRSIQVKPGKQKNIENLPLWRSVGSSDLRTNMLQDPNKVLTEPSIIKWLFLEELGVTELHSDLILTEVEAYQLKANESPKELGNMRLIFTIEMAQSLIAALNKIIEAKR